MNFKKWLQMDEVGTSTASVAHFSLPMGAGTTDAAMFRRTPVTMTFNDDLYKKKKPKHKKSH